MRSAAAAGRRDKQPSLLGLLPELNRKGPTLRTMPMESRRGEANQALPDCSLVRLVRGENDKDYCSF